MLVEDELRRLIQAVNSPFLRTDDIAPVDLDPVARITADLDDEPDLGIFTTERDSPVDLMTSTDEERRIAKETYEQMTPGSSGSFQAAQAATMQSPKSWFQQWGGGPNGDLSGFIPTEKLTPIEKGGHFMKPDAAKAYKAMQRAMRKDLGFGFSITDSYRSYDQQVALKKQKPSLAATPGHSNHGWGLALDINVNDSRVYDWLRKNGKRFGFEQPMDYEPWHWEYEGGYTASPKTTRKRPPNPRVKQQDPLNRLKSATSLITAPTVFGQIVSEVTNVPTDPQAWKARESNAKLEFVPQRYRKLIRDAAEATGLPARLIATVIQKESGFNPKAVSSAGAQGLMQIMPLHNLDNPFNARSNVMFGAQLLANYIEQMGSLRLGLAAYNAGPNNHEAGLGYAEMVLAAFRGEA